MVQHRARSLMLAAVVAAALLPAALSGSAVAQTSSTPPAGNTALYFAEGNTLPGWHEFITTLNPSTTETAHVAIKYSCEQPAGVPVSCGIPGDTVSRTIAPLTRDTIQVFSASAGGVNGVFTGVGATLTSDQPIVSERPMYMTQPPGAFAQVNGEVKGAHDARAQRPSDIWYLPEGTTQADFQEYLTILNPSTDTVTATITYSVEGAVAPVVRTVGLAPTSRTTIDVASSQPGGLGQQATGLSTIVTASSPVVVERPMYFIHDFGAPLGVVNGATDKPGASFATAAPSKLDFAEGNGLPDFAEFLTVLNTENRPGVLTLTYLVEGSTTPVVKTCPIGALARATINVSSAAGNPPALQPCALDRSNAGASVSKGVGAVLSADVAIAAERPMYFVRDFPEIGLTNGAHDVFGVADPEETSNQYFFAEGSTRNGFDQFWTITNPNATPIDVAVDYLYDASQGRANNTMTYTVPANSRKTVQVFNAADNGVGRSGDAGFDFGARATSAGGETFLIERPFYTKRSIFGDATDDGHDITGATPEEAFGPPPGEPNPSLALTKTAAPATFAGRELTYTLVTTNNGNVAQHLVTVTDVLPTGTTYVRSSGGTLSGTIVTFAEGSLSAGATATATVVVTASDPGPITNTASARSSDGVTATAQAGTVVVSPTPFMLRADMTGTKEVPPNVNSTDTASATFLFDPIVGQVNWEVTTDMTTAITGWHIHKAPAGVNGPIVINFPNFAPLPPQHGTASGTAPVALDLMAAIAVTPSGYYANIHTTQFPGGAVRGQLTP